MVHAEGVRSGEPCWTGFSFMAWRPGPLRQCPRRRAPCCAAAIIAPCRWATMRPSGTYYRILSMGKVIPLKSRGLKARKSWKLRLRPPCLGSNKPGLPAQIWGFVFRTSRTNPAKPRCSEPSSICHQPGFVSAVVSGLCPSMEFPVDRKR